MKKGLSTIILLVLTLALAFCGYTGLKAVQAQQANAKSAFGVFSEQYDGFVSEGNIFLAQGDIALANIEGYMAQLQSNCELMKAEKADTAEVEALITSAAAQQEEAESNVQGMKETYEKMIAAAEGITEASTQEDMDSAISKVSKYRNIIQRNLRKVTKIDESESTKSAETVVRQACERSVALITVACPDAEIPEQFAAEVFAVEKMEVEEEERSFLADNYSYFFWLAGCAFLAMVLCLIGWIKPSLLEKVGSVANKNMMLIALVFITLLFFVLTNYTILTPTNVSNIINQNAYIIILACGMLLCIVCSGNIDLSVGRVIGFIGACAAKFMIDGKMPVSISIVLCLLIGIAIGAWQGFWISYMHIPAFIVTLAGQLTFYGLTMMILQGFTIAGFPNSFATLFCSYIGDPFKGLIPGVNSLALFVGIIGAIAVIFIEIRNRMQRKRKGYKVEPIIAMLVRTLVIAVVIVWLFYSLAKAKGIPTVLITVGIVLAIYAFVTSKTVMGRHLYAMGGNVNAARLSGVKTQKMLFLAYTNMGLLAGLAGLVYAARLNAASPQAGSGDELYAIASCYIGGASAYGGIGTIGGALIGALTMGVIKNGMSIMGLGQDIQQIMLGMVLLIAVVIDVVSKQKISFPFHLKLSRKTKT